MKKTISMVVVLMAFGLWGTVYAGNESVKTSDKAGTSKVSKDTEKPSNLEDEEEAAEQAKAPKTIKECEKMIAEKTAEMEKAEEGKKGGIQKEIDQLKEVLKNMREFKKSNKKD